MLKFDNWAAGAVGRFGHHSSFVLVVCARGVTQKSVALLFVREGWSGVGPIGWEGQQAHDANRELSLYRE